MEFAVWGGFHGLALSTERLVTGKIRIKHSRFTLFINRVFVFLMVTLAWLLFKLPRFDDVLLYFKSMFNNLAFADNISSITYIFLYSLPVVLYHAAYLYRHSAYIQMIKKREFIPYALMLFLIITNSGTPGTFIYFQF